MLDISVLCHTPPHLLITWKVTTQLPAASTCPGGLPLASGVYCARARGWLGNENRCHSSHPSPDGALSYVGCTGFQLPPRGNLPDNSLSWWLSPSPSEFSLTGVSWDYFPKELLTLDSSSQGLLSGEPILQESPIFCSFLSSPNQDFSGNRYPVATLHPSGPEPLDTLTLCPQKELTGRVRPSPGVRTSATIQAGPEKNSAEEEDDEEDADDKVNFQPYLEPPSFLGQEHQIPGDSKAGDTWSPPVQVEGWSATDASDRSWASAGGSSPWDESESSCYLAKKMPGQGPGGDRCQEPLPLPEFSKDLSFLEDPRKDDLSSWASWGSLLPGLDLLPGEPPVSLRTLTFCWDSNPEEEEEAEEDEEGSEEGGGRESEIEDDSPGIWGAGRLQKTEVRGRTLGHYMAR